MLGTFDSVKNKEDLWSILVRNADGVEEEQFQDSYKTVMDDIKEMTDIKKIFRIQNTDTKRYILYPNDDRYNVDVFPEFRTLWSNIKIPDEVDLEKEMTEAGLTMLTQEKKTKRPAQKEKKRKSSSRRMKLTNVHLKDLDLTKEFVPGSTADNHHNTN